MITAQAAASRMSNLLVAETKIHTSANEVGGLVGSADAVTIQKVFADAELHMPYQAAPQNTAAFVGSVTGESAISECVVAGGVYPQDPGSTRYKLMYMNNPDDINELKAFKNCFVNTDTPGYQIVGTDPQGVTQDSLQSEAFYQSDLKLDPNIWNWLMQQRRVGRDSMRWMQRESDLRGQKEHRQKKPHYRRRFRLDMSRSIRRKNCWRRKTVPENIF